MSARAGATGTKRRWVAVGMATVIGMAGCGGDSKLAVGEPTSEAAEYCAKSLAIETAPEPDIDFETATPEQLQAGVKAYAAQLLPLAEEALAVSPAEVKADIQTLVGATRSVSQTGDFSVFENDAAVTAAGDRAHAYDLENCGWGKAEVVGEDYEYEGLPDESEAGPVSFDLSNEGKEPHEMVIFRIKDGVEESFDELLALPEEQSQSKIEFAGVVEPVDPGGKDYSVANLTEGRYGVVCFIPIGGGEEGPPHFTQGMKGEIEVG